LRVMLNSMMSKLAKLLPRQIRRRHSPVTVMLLPLMELTPSKPSQRTTANLTLNTLLNSPRRNSLLVLVFQMPASQMRVASRTRNGPTLRSLPRKKKRTLLQHLLARLSASVNASRSKFLTSTNALLKPLNVPPEAVSEEIVAIDHPEVATEAAEETSEDVTVIAVDEDVDAAAMGLSEEPLAAVPNAATPDLVHQSTLRIKAPSPVWDHRLHI